MIAIRRPASRAASRMRPMTSACFEKSPCEKLSRATFNPAAIRRRSISGDSEAGPIVATIFVLCLGNLPVFIRPDFDLLHYGAFEKGAAICSFERFAIVRFTVKDDGADHGASDG